MLTYLFNYLITQRLFKSDKAHFKSYVALHAYWVSSGNLSAKTMALLKLNKA